MRTRLTTNLRAAGTGTCPDAKAVQTLADDYARNAARFYEREGYHANSHDYFMPVWSCARDEEAKLEGLAWTLFLPGYLDGLGVKYDIDNLKVGDGAALAEWITTQLAADRIWGTPAYCAGVVEPRPFPTRHAESEVIRMLHSLSVRVEEGFYALTYDAQRSVVVKTLIGAFLYDPLGQFP